VRPPLGFTRAALGFSKSFYEGSECCIARLRSSLRFLLGS
jgi:hypothetical protein